MLNDEYTLYMEEEETHYDVTNKNNNDNLEGLDKQCCQLIRHT